MIFDTIIARQSDGLFLAEVIDESKEEVGKAKRKVKQLLKFSLSTDGALLKSVEVESFNMQ